MRFFNTAGPVDCADHYCLPPLERFDLKELLRLIAQKKYFVLHAPRQTGKTTCLLALRDYLNQAGDFCCLYFNVEPGQTSRGEVASTTRTVLDEMAIWSRTTFGDPFLDDIIAAALEKREPQSAFSEVLALWAAREERPLVLLIDEIDTLEGDGLISVQSGGVTCGCEEGSGRRSLSKETSVKPTTSNTSLEASPASNSFLQ
ncbi:MAG: hypothetical protein V3T83_00920 [Acidobacteriota bacterium]